MRFKRCFKFWMTWSILGLKIRKWLKKDRLKAAMEKGMREGEFYGIVLRKCKLHDGPLTSVNELQTFLKTQK